MTPPTAREEILARIRQALADVPPEDEAAEQPEVSRPTTDAPSAPPPAALADPPTDTRPATVQTDTPPAADADVPATALAEPPTDLPSAAAQTVPPPAADAGVPTAALAEPPTDTRSATVQTDTPPLAEPPTDTPSATAQTVPRGYLPEHGRRTEAENVDLLAENLADYRAQVHRATELTLPGTIARLLTEHGSSSVAIPEALPEAWLAELPGPVAAVLDSADLTPRRLDEVQSVISGCALAIAETGTIILDGGPGQGRRLLTLVPDHHICVVRVPEQVVSSVPRALEPGGGLSPTRPQTWIAGPSATSDIELDRVEGVHGPRRLEVILLEASPIRT
jgi:L-lactate dehydrogenase complex protein LldG